ncbi:MAG: hypothetical protein ABIE68_04835 [bacterium]
MKQPIPMTIDSLFIGDLTSGELVFNVVSESFGRLLPRKNESRLIEFRNNSVKVRILDNCGELTKKRTYWKVFNLVTGDQAKKELLKRAINETSKVVRRETNNLEMSHRTGRKFGVYR